MTSNQRAAGGQTAEARKARRGKPQPNSAKRMECVQLAGAFEPPAAHESGSKLHALHTLREVAAASESL